MQQSNAVMTHDAEVQLIRAPAQITFGRHDMVTSTRFADALKNGIKKFRALRLRELLARTLYENVSAFNEKTLAFLKAARFQKSCERLLECANRRAILHRPTAEGWLQLKGDISLAEDK
jgi:hypothetical protein